MAAPRRVREELSAPVATMPMAGSDAMLTVWMRMPGQTWPGAAASFLGMWIMMTAAMMLPSLAPTLRRYREAIAGAGAPRRDALTALVAIAYFVVWAAVGAMVFPLGDALAQLQLRQPALARVAPIAVGVIVTMAGAAQRSAWKAHRLARCREAFWRGGAPSISAATAWRHGLRLGLDCVCSCAGPMAILLVVGIMDLRAMAVATIAITAERHAPAGVRAARVTGTVAVAAGVFLIARAVAIG